jgi:deoxyribose-phosphate aldolase
VSVLPPWLARFAEGSGLATIIDHTLLNPEATQADIERLTEEAVSLRFGAVCVNGQWVGLAARRLAGSLVRVVAVVGFPLGAGGEVAKCAEVRAVVADGAAEIDVVMARGWAKAGRWDKVRDEMALIVEAAGGRLVKVILETAALTTGEIERACLAALASGAGMVKTSTGFHPGGGATVEAVRLMRSVVGNLAGVKASGGIRTAADARRMLQAGADRIGTSAAAGWGDALNRRLDEYLAGDNPG